MSPSMKRLLVEGAELFQQDCNSIDRVMSYLDSNLHMMHDQLNEENFDRILDIIWNILNEILVELIQSNLEVREVLRLQISLYTHNRTLICDI